MTEEKGAQAAVQKKGRKPWTLREFGGKTVWDWLQLLVVPLALAGIGLFFTSTQKYARQLEEARQRAQEAESQAQHSALQAYFDQMQHLILEEDLLGRARRIT